MTRIYKSEVNKTVGGEAGQLEGQCVVDLSAMLTVVKWTLQSILCRSNRYYRFMYLLGFKTVANVFFIGKTR